ncbi:hypothetical protein AWJ20_123 [Sugiyamaella lignohabitans]|uniref:protein O-GlcNAc transferase n=1 Tax=Sugiyamaella lignohabitans TaxID=796027 RepID=A0A167CMU1_9ASCO|nr:uncharacterized protein AWJ20_123 [Sugiyamaella lignohabitans]ANB11896.1 hypothetical protein AWJ20_123 [Sugiyamaella lignohabitans]
MGNLQVSSGQYVQAAKSFASAVIFGLGGSVENDGRHLGVGTLNDLKSNSPINRRAISSIPDLVHAIDQSLRGSPVSANACSSHSPLLLSPQQALQARYKLFPPDGQLPLVSQCQNNQNTNPQIPVDSLPSNYIQRYNNMGREDDPRQTSASIEAIVSNALLNLSKIFQDGINSGAPDKVVYLNGRVPSTYDILSLYLLSLSLNASASTANNVGILLLASVTQSPMSSNLPCQNCERRTRDLALDYYLFGLSLDQKHPHLHTNLGSLLREQGKLNEAVQMYQKAIQCDPHFNIALANLAGCLKDQGQIDKAIIYYARAVQENPDFVEALVGLASCYGSVCNWTDRGGCGWEQMSVDIEGNLVSGQIEGWVTRVIKVAENQVDEVRRWGIGAIDFIDSVEGGNLFKTIERTVRISDPNERVKFRQLINSWRGCYEEGTNLLSLIEKTIRAVQRQWYLDRRQGVKPPVPDYTYARPHIPSVLPIPLAPSILPFHSFTLPLNSFYVRQISEKAASRVSMTVLSQNWLPKHVYPPPASPKNGVLKVAYISSDFANHPLAHLMQNVFGMHDRTKVHAYCYATSPSDSSQYRQEIEKGAYVFRDVSSWSTQKIVEQLVSDGIHISVNLNGFTKGGRNEIFATRPCPVQISLMGFAGPMGADWCDYVLGDITAMNGVPQYSNLSNNDSRLKLIQPPDENMSSYWPYRKEKVIYMPRTLFCCDHRQSAPDSNKVRIESGQPLHTWEADVELRQRLRKQLFPNLPEGAFLMGNFNQLYKIDPTIFVTWLRILQRLPHAYLWLLEFPKNGRTNLYTYAYKWTGSRDILSRIIFTPVAEKNEHIIRSRVCDLFLDTPECNAHTTAADVSWGGTPIITYPRHSYKLCSRIGASIVYGALPADYRGRQIGQRLVVHSEAEYEDRVVEFGSTLEGLRELNEIRTVLFNEREKDGNGLFNTKKWVESVEKGFQRAWEDWVQGKHENIFID